MEKTNGQLLMEKLQYDKKNVYEESSNEDIKKMFDYAEGYKQYLDNGKTERECVDISIEMVEKYGYTEYKLGDEIKVGDKKYFNNRNKSLAIFKVGEMDIEKQGIRILASHIDSPRIDIKQNPLYEDSGMAFLKTHYYGGIKKYQWTATPLALHGVVTLASGETKTVIIGEKDTDPVFYINDLLPHLGRELAQKPLASAIDGETLNIVIGGLPYDDSEVKERLKLSVLAKLNEMYGMVEQDFLSAELMAVPAFKARDIGLDRAFIGAYGHDDRVCSYPALTSLMELENNDRTVLVILADKEEIGSEGTSGMQCQVYEDIINEICKNLNKNASVVRSVSKCLSADVTACYDPNFASVYEKRNSSMMSNGTTMCKFTGSGGKGGSNDASSEFVGFVTKLFNDNNVIYQTAELGKVDAGGGGTVAKYIAKMNIETVDIGVPVISMHAPYEMVSKADVYVTHLAFLAFVK